MKKSYKIDVDCAACALKMEDAAKATAGVKDCVVNYMLLKMNVELKMGRIRKPLCRKCTRTAKRWRMTARFS